MCSSELSRRTGDLKSGSAAVRRSAEDTNLLPVRCPMTAPASWKNKSPLSLSHAAYSLSHPHPASCYVCSRNSQTVLSCFSGKVGGAGKWPIHCLQEKSQVTVLACSSYRDLVMEKGEHELYMCRGVAMRGWASDLSE